MPNYRTHDTAALVASPVVVFGASQLTNIPNALGLGIGFLLANRYLSPDLDIDSIMNRRWGIFYLIWYPYKKIFHHRSFWTHSGPISATIRFIYLAVWLLPILFVYIPPGDVILTIYISMVLADSLHTVLDKLL